MLLCQHKTDPEYHPVTAAPFTKHLTV